MTLIVFLQHYQYHLVHSTQIENIVLEELRPQS